MEEIQGADSLPEYINDFIQLNIDQLLRIYDEHKEETGALGFKCDRKNNNMEVFFMNEELIIELIKEDIWTQIKGEHEDKKIFIIQDIDINSIFLVYK